MARRLHCHLSLVMIRAFSSFCSLATALPGSWSWPCHSIRGLSAWSLMSEFVLRRGLPVLASLACTVSDESLRCPLPWSRWLLGLLIFAPVAAYPSWFAGACSALALLCLPISCVCSELAVRLHCCLGLLWYCPSILCEASCICQSLNVLIFENV